MWLEVEEHRGPGVFALLGVPDDECVSPARMDAIAADVRGHLDVERGS